MAVYSTLRSINMESNEIITAGLHSTYPQESALATFVNGTATPSILHRGNVALPIGSLFGDDLLGQDISIPSPVGIYTPEATDGEIVWFCSGCGDGPISSWQSVCVSCHHVRCDKCRVEKTQ